MGTCRDTADQPDRKAPEGSNGRAQVSPTSSRAAYAVSQICRGHILGLGVSFATCAYCLVQAQHPAPSLLR